MRNLPIPSTNDKKALTEIIRCKKKPYTGRLVRVRPAVKNRYNEYNKFSKYLENLVESKISGVSSDALIKCYTNRTKKMSELRQEILFPDLEDFDECPFCGIGEPTTLDHYLPKEDFPEFSVLSKNLIPICSACNSNYKGEAWIEHGKRLFIHTYYDSFPDEIFFRAEVSIDKGIVIEFSSIENIDEKYFSDIFKSHFKRLSLKKRYKIKASAEIKRKRRSLEKIYVKGSKEEVSNSLKEEAEDLKHELGKNHWKTVLYSALSNSSDFCDGGFREKVVR